VYGVANVSANLLISSMRPSLSAVRMLAGLAVMGAGLTGMALAVAFAPPDLLLPGLYAGLALAACGSPFCDIPLAMRVQLAGGPGAPRAAAASVFRVRLSMNFTGIMLAGLVSPTLFGTLGVAPTMLGSGLLCAAASLAALAALKGRG